MSDPLTRARRSGPRLLATASAAMLALTLAACGSSSTSSSSSSTTASSSAGSAAAGSATSGPSSAASGSATAVSYPVEIPNAYGTTVIPAAPENVVVLGFTDVDSVLAVGTVPVGIQQFGVGFDSGVGPWAEPLLEGATPTVFTSTTEINFEQIASLQPDLIVAVTRAITPDDYAKLTAIAPTLARPAEYPDFGVPPEVGATLIATALGKEAEMNDLLAENVALVQETAAANPQFAGTSFSAVWPRPEGAGWFAWTDIDPRVQLMTALGFTLSPHIEALGNDTFYKEISKENTPEINADVVVAIDANDQQAVVLADPLYQSLPAAQGGNVAWVVDPAVIGAFNYASVLSLPFALENLVPLLDAAVAGTGGAASSSAAPTS
jgi:iron complex transport system substrate-binding protein